MRRQQHARRLLVAQHEDAGSKAKVVEQAPVHAGDLLQTFLREGLIFLAAISRRPLSSMSPAKADNVARTETHSAPALRHWVQPLAEPLQVHHCNCGPTTSFRRIAITLQGRGILLPKLTLATAGSGPQAFITDRNSTSANDNSHLPLQRRTYRISLDTRCQSP